MIGFLLLIRVAHKLVYYGVALVPFALVFFLCRGYFPGWPPATVIVAFVISLVLSFLLGFFLEATIGMIGFWFLEVSSLLFVYMLFNFFFSGHMFPLDMLPRRGTRSCWRCRCNTWPIFRRPCSWKRFPERRCGRASRCKPPGSCFSSSPAASHSAAACGAIAGMEDEESLIDER